MRRGGGGSSHLNLSCSCFDVRGGRVTFDISAFVDFNFAVVDVWLPCSFSVVVVASSICRRSIFCRWCFLVVCLLLLVALFAATFQAGLSLLVRCGLFGLEMLFVSGVLHEFSCPSRFPLCLVWSLGESLLFLRTCYVVYIGRRLLCSCCSPVYRVAC